MGGQNPRFLTQAIRGHIYKLFPPSLAHALHDTLRHTQSHTHSKRTITAINMDAQPTSTAMSVDTLPATESKQQEPEQSVMRLRGGGICVDCLA